VIIILFIRVGHYDYSPRASENQVTPLARTFTVFEI